MLFNFPNICHYYHMIPSLISEHFYFLLTLALLIGGIPALLTAIYLSTQGFVDFKILFAIFFVTGLLWDMVWYAIGVYVSKFRSDFVTKRVEKVKKAHLYGLLEDHFFKAVFMSRFLYGTNSAISVVAGVKHVRFARFVVICAVTLCIWFGIMTLLGFTISNTLEGFQHTVGQILRGILLFWVIAILVLLMLKNVFMKFHRKH
jgi:membrane protein DedA with SNARE-associated domain